MEKNPGKEYIIFKIQIIMKVIGRKIKEMDMEYNIGLMGIYIEEIGQMIKCVVKVLFNQEMGLL